MKTDGLAIHEEILLLALRNDTGTVAGGATYAYAIGAAIVAELVLRGRVELDTSGRRPLAQVVDRAPLGEPLLDEALQRMADAKRRAALPTWVQRLGHLRRLKHRVAQGLVDRGILRADEVRVLGIFPRTVYPEVDPAPEREIVARLERAVFIDGTEVAPRTVVLLSVANAAGLLRQVLDRKRLKTRKRRIEAVVNGEAMGRATREAIQAAHAAAAMAAIMPAIIATTTATH